MGVVWARHTAGQSDAEGVWAVNPEHVSTARNSHALQHTAVRVGVPQGCD